MLIAAPLQFQEIKPLKMSSNKIFLLLLIYSTILFSCNVNNKNSGVKKISFITTFPEVKFTGELFYLHDSAILFYSGNYFVYKLPFQTGEIRTDTIKSDMADSVLIYIEPTGIGYKYFAGKKEDKYCYLFNSLNDKTGLKKHSVDSIIARWGIGTLDINAVIKNAVLIDSVSDQINNNITKVYSPKIIKDDGDTIILYFTNHIKETDFSLSKSIDSSNRFKLYKIRVLYNQKLSQTQNMAMPKRELSFEINELNAKNDTEILDLFKRLKSNKL